MMLRYWCQVLAVMSMMLLLATPALSQEGEEAPAQVTEEEAEEEAPEGPFTKLASGGFGYAMVGLHLGEFGIMGRNLTRPDSLTSGATPSNFGLTFGGGGRYLLGNRILIGGKGYGVVSGTGSNGIGESVIAGGGGGFDFGFTIYNEQPWMVYPFFGLGGAGVSMEVTNNSNADITFGDEVVAAGQTESFSTGFVTVEAGMGFQHLLHDGDGGFQIGAEAGLLASIGQGIWVNAAGNAVEGVSNVNFDGFYVRLTIGGGGYDLEELDTDKDGISDRDDACRTDAEDKDGFEDEDGCPEEDNDSDGLLDDDDECPNEPEDKDGFEDEDGCPDLDNDKDGVLDSADKCPAKAEDKDGFEDEDGCPEADNDKDGVLDGADKCPDKAEDKDGFEDEDGCPEADNDRDGILDASDKCPNEPETLNGVEDEDGCPDEDKGKAIVDMKQKEIIILQRVFFETGKAEIKEQSFALLNAVSLILKGNPEVTLIEVQGHTDDRGNDTSNMELSDKRAKSVREFLIQRGISADRLAAKGYGESQPAVKIDGLGGGKLNDARTKNRRVQFKILKQK